MDNMEETNNPDFFPRLHFYELVRIAYTWGHAYEVIKRIWLFQGVFPKYDYVLVAEAKKIVDRSDPLFSNCEEFAEDWRFDNNSCEFLHSPLLYIYKSEPPKRIRHEIKHGRWRFIKVMPMQDLDSLKSHLSEKFAWLAIPDNFWLLYEQGEEKSHFDNKGIPRKGIDILKGVEGEIRMLFDELKVGGLSSYSKEDQMRFKKKAIGIFKKKKRHFTLVTEDSLDVAEFYEWTDVGKEREKFCGKLARKILYANNVSVQDYQKIYSVLRQLKNR